ncbi:Integrase catalytic domain-containing protein [Citrus sinensis]|uniref:Integrase catalytic domain-containing protein n=1 Tax=Citrus sinensis TaxID=2711 RepID=A0ACB8JD83_CITSI|nr:Integrase catalytic domain-containing protein [Citrus sinensis]
MATLNDSTFREGQSTTRPPFFDGNYYAYWKTRMRIYLQALDYEIWEVVCDGPFLPLTKNEFGEDIPKPSRKWNELEKRKASLNSKTMNALFCALDKKEFHRVSSCESANEIWHKLEVVYEGTNQVKESKISRYTRQYELFQMEQNESVYSMYTRFTDIVNTLGALGKTFSNSEKVKKIIRSLPKEWRPKRTAIEEAKDLNTLPLDDLIGSLISYEEDLAAEKGHEEKKKSIALKASKYESDGESELDDEELAMLARRFRKFFKKTGERRNFINFKNHREKNEAITCYECKKPGHIRSECPLIKKLKKKAMVATWDDSEEDSIDEKGSYASLKGKYYAFVIVDDYSRYTWVLFLANKDDAFDAFKVLCKKIQNEKGYGIACIRSDHGGEFENHAFEIFCNDFGIEHQFSSPRTAQQNGVVERKNRSIQEMVRTMLNENSLPKYFWAETVNTACYVLNRVLIRPNLNKTLYELWKHRKPNISYFKVFGCKCFILNTKDNLGKFDPKSNVGIFLGYSNSSKAYRVYNKNTLVVEEYMHVTFDESNPSSTEKVVVDNDVDEDLQKESSNDNQKDASHGNQDEHEEMNVEQNEGASQSLPKEWRYVSSHPKDVILGDPSRGVTTRSSLRNTCEHNAFISQIEPKSFADAENDESWIMAMQEELNQFERNNLWELVPKPEHQSVIGTKWIFRNKMDESGVVVRNKSRLVAQDDFSNLVVCGKSVRDMLQPWEFAIDFDDRVYPNLVRVFYSNMEISATRLNRIVTQVGGVPIEFDDADLADFLGISSEGHDIYTSRKALFFDTFCHTDGVRNICRRRDFSDEIFLLPFRSQLLPLQVRILHTILQHIVTPRKGHLDEVTSIITKILRRFEVPLLDTDHMETRRIGPEAMTSIGFSMKNREWIKTSNSKNQDTLIAPEDDRMLNDVYPPDKLPDFRLGAHPPKLFCRSLEFNGERVIRNGKPFI